MRQFACVEVNKFIPQERIVADVTIASDTGTMCGESQEHSTAAVSAASCGADRGLPKPQIMGTYWK